MASRLPPVKTGDTRALAADDGPVRRRRLRLEAYDYRNNGAYFITVVTEARAPLFGSVIESEVRLTDLGQIVEEEWTRSSALRPEVALDYFVVMPNHVHGIVSLDAGERQARTAVTLPARSLGAFVAGFKSATTRRVNSCRNTPGESVWQRNYFERIIRDDHELEMIRTYIENNPRAWLDDAENPDATNGTATTATPWVENPDSRRTGRGRGTPRPYGPPPRSSGRQPYAWGDTECRLVAGEARLAPTGLRHDRQDGDLFARGDAD